MFYSELKDHNEAFGKLAHVTRIGGNKGVKHVKSKAL